MTSQSPKEFYHVYASLVTGSYSERQNEWEFNLSEEQLEQRILAPYRKAESMVIEGRVIPNDGSFRIRIFGTDRSVNSANDFRPHTQYEVTSEFITQPPGSELEERSPTSQVRPAANVREVFVIHGRNLDARDALFEFLRAIDLHPLEWSEVVQATGRPSPYVGEILDAAFSKAHAVVALFTPDDEARLGETYRTKNEPAHETQLTGQARPNVLFEAGMAMARNQDRTVLVELGDLRPFSDLAGRHVVRMDNTSQRRQELAQRLEIAGCPVNLEGTEWHSAGDFGEVLGKIDEQRESSQRDSVHGAESIASTTLADDAWVLLKEAANDGDGLGPVHTNAAHRR